MKFKNLLLLFSLVIVFCSSKAIAQDVCVIGEKNVAKFEGVVRQADKQAIPEALVKVYKKSVEEKPIAEVKTDANGRFEIPSLRDGKYIVSVSYPNFVKLVFPVRIAKKEKPNCKLIVILGWNYNESCGGGKVLIEN